MNAVSLTVSHPLNRTETESPAAQSGGNRHKAGFPLPAAKQFHNTHLRESVRKEPHGTAI